MLARLWRDMVDPREWVETRKALRAAKPYTFANIPDGAYGRLVGRVVALAPPILAPFSERICVAHITVAPGAAQALVVAKDSVPFALEGNGTRAIVDLRHARVSLSRTHQARARGFREPTPAQRELLDRIVGPDIVPDTIAFEESIIADGDELVIAGFSIHEYEGHTDEHLYRGTRTRMRLAGTEERPLLIANDRRLV